VGEVVYSILRSSCGRIWEWGKVEECEGSEEGLREEMELGSTVRLRLRLTWL
jgi:hypothetical protein